MRSSLIWSILLQASDENGLLSSELWELGTTGIEETAEGVRAWFEDVTDSDAVRARFAHLVVSVDHSAPPVWVQEAEDRDPVYVGTRFVIVPATATPASMLVSDRIVLPIDAAMAFGSGRHETTQLCLEALERFLKPGDTVFDVGCGSGILALACQKLGAGLVAGADIDESAVRVARRHYSGPLFVGSADGYAENRADIVLSNITGKVNDRLADQLLRIIKPSGWLILSGFTAEGSPKNFAPEHILRLRDWQCWICKPGQIRINPGQIGENHHESKWWL